MQSQQLPTPTIGRASNAQLQDLMSLASSTQATYSSRVKQLLRGAWSAATDKLALLLCSSTKSKAHNSHHKSVSLSGWFITAARGSRWFFVAHKHRQKVTLKAADYTHHTS